LIISIEKPINSKIYTSDNLKFINLDNNNKVGNILAAKNEVVLYYGKHGELPKTTSSYRDYYDGDYLEYHIKDANHFFLCNYFLKDNYVGGPITPNNSKNECYLYDSSGDQQEIVPYGDAIMSIEKSPTPTVSSMLGNSSFDPTGFTKIKDNLYMKITSFKIEEGDSIKIYVDVLALENIDEDIDLSNIHMDYIASGGKTIDNKPFPTTTVFHLHAPQKLTMDLSYSAIGTGPAYTFNYLVTPSKGITLGVFH
jgi:hypothetical protein